MQNSASIADMDSSTSRRISSSRHGQQCQATCFEALSTALQHPSVSSDPAMVCSVLQTCKSWRAALQASTAASITFRTQSNIMMTNIPLCQVVAFASWLPSHAGLVGEIIMDYYHWAPSKTFAATYHKTAEQLITRSLQRAAVDANPGVKLHRFTANVLVDTDLLHALPASTLTQLRLDSCFSNISINSVPVVQAIGQLTRLKELDVSGLFIEAIGAACLEAISKLTRLSSLHLAAADETCDYLKLPCQLKQLTLYCSHPKWLTPPASAISVAIGQLSVLQQLDLGLLGALDHGSALPTSLSALTLNQPWPWHAHDGTEHLAISRLQNLQQIVLSDAMKQPQQLQQLSSLASLRHIRLTYVRMCEASTAAPAWRHLKQLQSLCIDDETMSSLYGDDLSAQQSKAVLEAISVATGLTCLQLKGDPFYNPDRAPVCKHFSLLTQLRHLELQESSVPDQLDMLQLSCLTGLTCLVVIGVEAAGDMAVVGLATHLKQLHQLQLLNNDVYTCAILPALASLTALTKLCICYDPSEALRMPDASLPAEYLSLLTVLSNLRWFECGLFDAADVHELWDASGRRWRVNQSVL